MRVTTGDIRVTVDGVAIKKGDRVWRTTGASVNRRKVDAWDLTDWAWQFFGKQIYSTEFAAVAAAIVLAKKDLKKAKAEVRRAGIAIARLTARLEVSPCPPAAGRVGWRRSCS